MARPKRQTPWKTMSFIVNIALNMTRLIVLLSQDCDQP